MRSYKGNEYKPSWDEYDIFIPFISLKDAAKKYHYSIVTIHQWATEGRIVAVKIGNSWVVRESSLKRFIDSRDSS